MNPAADGPSSFGHCGKSVCTVPLVSASQSPPAVRVERYDRRWRDDFARLNLEWLERWFSVEPVDQEVLRDPELHVLAGGGCVLFAVDEQDHALGTVALKCEGGGVYELTKMAVDPSVRGGGIGRLLVRAALEEFRAVSGRELFLESSTKLGPALRLYESVGFVHQPRGREDSSYSRADVYMIWDPVGSVAPCP